MCSAPGSPFSALLLLEVCLWRSLHPFCLTPGECCPEGNRYRSNHRWKFNSGLFIQEEGNSTGDGVKKRQMDVLRGERFCLKKMTEAERMEQTPDVS